MSTYRVVQVGCALVGLLELALLVVVWRWADAYRHAHGEGNGLLMLVVGGAFWLAGSAGLLRSVWPSDLNPDLSRRLSLVVATSGTSMVLLVLLFVRSAAT